MPVRVILGQGLVRGNRDVFSGLGKRAAVICDEAAALSGALADISGVLEAGGIEYTVFDKVESNPTVECAYKAKSAADSARPDMIIGVGGGSPMDAAKAVSLLCAQAALTPERLAGGDFQDKTLPLIEIPTTSGTGSEVTPFAMITNHVTNRKINLHAPSMYAKTALLDPAYTESVPQSVRVNTGVDALSHAIESVLALTSNPFVDAIAGESLKKIGSCLGPMAAARKLSFDERERMMYGAALAGIAVGQTRTTVLHGMSYSLTVHRNLPHGRAIALLLMGYLRFNAEKVPLRVKFILDSAGIDSLDALEAVINSMIGKREAFTEDEIDLYTTEVLGLHNLKNCLAIPDREQLKAFLRERRHVCS